MDAGTSSLLTLVDAFPDLGWEDICVKLKIKPRDMQDLIRQRVLRLDGVEHDQLPALRLRPRAAQEG
jgi:hypothetical protein